MFTDARAFLGSNLGFVNGARPLRCGHLTLIRFLTEGDSHLNQAASWKRCFLAANFRGDASSIVGTGDRQARRIVAALLQKSILLQKTRAQRYVLLFRRRWCHAGC